MKSLLLILLALMGCVGLSQTWTDGKGLVAKYRDFKMVRTRNLDYIFTLAGNVSVASDPQGLSLASNKMNLDAAPDPKNPKSILLQHATATGQVTVVKTVSSKSGKQTTRIDGSKAEYTSGVTESLVKIDGPMKIQSYDASQHPTMVVTGSSGVATLEPLKQSNMNDGLRKATVEGPVHLVLTQVNPKTKMLQTVRATSDLMILENQGTGRKVTLTGSVHIVGDSVGELSNAKVAVFVIKNNGDFKMNTSGAK